MSNPVSAASSLMLTHGRLPWLAGMLSCGVGSPCRTEPSNCFTIFCRPCAQRLTAPHPPNSALVHRPAYARAGFGVCASEGRVCSPAAPTRLRRRLLGLQYTLHEERSVTQSPPTESQLSSSGSCSSAGAGAAAAGRGNRLVVKINFTTLDATGATGRPPGAGAGM